MAVVGGGDAAGEKCKNQIEAKMKVVGTVGNVIDSGQAWAKSKMSGWQTMQGNWVAEDAMGGGGGKRKAVGRRRMQQEGGADNVRQLGGRGCNKRGVNNARQWGGG